MPRSDYLKLAETTPPSPTERTTPPLRLELFDGELVPPPSHPDHIFDPMGGTIPHNEPIFFLRACDLSAPLALAAWIGANEQTAPHLIPAAKDMLRRMQQWPDRRPAGRKPAISHHEEAD